MLNKMKILLSGLAIGVTTACQPVYVQDSYPPGVYPANGGEWSGGIRARVDRARGFIDHGIRQGTLTRSEAQDLNRQLDGVSHRIDRMVRDGHLSHAERGRIDDELDRLERNIKREMRDDDRRGRY